MHILQKVVWGSSLNQKIGGSIPGASSSCWCVLGQDTQIALEDWAIGVWMSVNAEIVAQWCCSCLGSPFELMKKGGTLSSQRTAVHERPPAANDKQSPEARLLSRDCSLVYSMCIINNERVWGPNCNTVNTALPLVPGNTLNTSEVDQMSCFWEEHRRDPALQWDKW